MKTKTRKTDFVFCFIFCIMGLFMAHAENKSTYTQLEDARNALLTDVSPNGEYMLFYTGEYRGALYKRSTKEYINLSADFPVYAKRVNDNGIVVGEFLDENTLVEGKSVLTAGYWKDGTWFKLPYPEGYTVTFEESAPSCWGVNADASVIVGSIYYDGFSKYYPIIWKNFLYDTILREMPYTHINPVKNVISRPTGISNNGKVIYGWGNNYRADGSQIADRSPVLWYGTDSAISLEIPSVYPKGEVSSMNQAGTMAVGNLDQKAFIWDAEHGTIVLDRMELYHTQAFGLGVADDGTVVGISASAAPNSRRSFIRKNGIVYNLKDYAQELYGVDLEKLELEYVKISADGKLFFGTDSEGYPYILSLEGDYLPTRPQNITAKQIKNTTNVKVKWKLPFPNEMNIVSYNVYRDGLKVNTSAVGTNLEFLDTDVPEGVHEYTVTTVYTGDKESVKSKGVTIQMIALDGCISPQNLALDLEYNLDIKLNWSTPSSTIPLKNTQALNRISSKDTLKGDRSHITKVGAPKDAEESKFDTVTNFEFLSATELNLLGEQALASDGEYIYTAIWDQPGIGKYALDGTYIETLAIEGAADIFNLTYDGTYFYATLFNRTPGGSMHKDTLYKFDFKNKVLVEKIKLEKPAMYVAYIPELDEGEGGFLYGNTVNSRYANKQGATIGNGIMGNYVYGVTYYNGQIFALEQEGNTKLEKFAQLKVYDIISGKPAGTVVNVYKYPQFNELPYFYGGGITMSKNMDGTLCAMMLLLTEPRTLLVSLEVEKMEGLLGYNIYKNNEKLNSTPYPYRNFVDRESDAGTYTYKISAVFDNGCESAKTDSVSTLILPQGSCQAPTNISAQSHYEYVTLKWEEPNGDDDQELLGYNVYRNDEKINNVILTVPTFVDEITFSGEKTLNYQVSTFYKLGCENKSEAVEVQFSDKGKELAISNLNAKVENADIIVEWERPYYDHPLPLRYGTGIKTDLIGLNDAGNFMGVIGWTPQQLKAHEGFTLVGIETYIGDLPTAMNAIVMVDEKIVIDQKIDVATIKEHSFNYFELDEPIKIDTALELVVGFDIKQAEDAKYILGVDAGPAVTKFGDLISLDFGETWQYLQNSNWIIAAKITKYRELDEKLLGYDIYINDLKQNDSPLKETKYIHSDLVPNTMYKYKVASLWNTLDSILSNEVSILYVPTNIETETDRKVQMYPVPVTDKLHIENIESYQTLEIKDLIGRSIYTQTISGDSESIECSFLQKGTYLLLLKENSGRVYTRKFVKN